MPQTPSDFDVLLEPDSLLLIVVGAHLRAELFDRPTAYSLQHAAASWIGRSAPPDAPALVPLVCTDIWCLNQPELRGRPTIALGGPEVNALSAMLAARLPSVFSIRDKYAVHLDLTFGDLVALCWGADGSATASGVEAFRERYLVGFLRAALERQAVGR